MTFWIYNPLELVKPSNVLIYKNKNLGDGLNFCTLLVLFFSAYAKKYIPNLDWKKFISISLFFIVFIGLLLTSSEKDEVLASSDIPNYSNYKFSLSVD